MEKKEKIAIFKAILTIILVIGGIYGGLQYIPTLFNQRNVLIPPTITAEETITKIRLFVHTEDDYEIVRIGLSFYNEDKERISTYTYQDENLVKNTVYEFSHEFTYTEIRFAKTYKYGITEYK